MISRRQFLRGNFSAGNQAADEPGAPGKAVIGAACVAYNNAVCRSCGDVCGEAAIRFSPRVMAAALPEVIAERCTGCSECVSACPVSAITLTGGESR